jgi:two-component system sensor histidine kinase KdpD
MLEAARRQQLNGVDVAAALVETHRRPETEAYLSWFEVIPPRRLAGGALEMDLDAVLARRPRLALVDALEHAAPQGLVEAGTLRHARRYQEVQELLNQGIDVFTTLNVYHLESLNDVVYQILGARIDETVPDALFDVTSDIELVDLPVDELLQRSRQGRVTFPPHLDAALRKKGNLTALRELSLRRAAGQADDQMRAYMKLRAIPGPWPAGERLMVCISAHPLSERLVRAGRRLAEQLNAEWFVVTVATPERLRFSARHNQRVQRTLHLAEDLGAQVRRAYGRSVPEAVGRFARENNITKIVVGKPLRPRLMEILNGSVVDEIIRASLPVDVYVISDAGGPVVKGLPEEWRPKTAWFRYLQAALLVAAVTALSYPIHFFIDPINLVMLYLLGVIVAALYLGRGPAALAALLGVLTFDFFMIEPRLSFSVANSQYLISFLGLFGVGLLVSSLAGQLRAQVEALTQREASAGALYEFSRALAAVSDLAEVQRAIIAHVEQALHRRVILWLPEREGGRLETAAVSNGLPSQAFPTQAAEAEIAAWTYEHRQPAGYGTDTHPAARLRFQPLMTQQRVIGVLGLDYSDASAARTQALPADQRALIDAYASLSALAVERVRLAEQAQSAQLAIETEKLQSALLHSISHDLRTPLASITGAFSSLYEAEERAGAEGVQMDDDMRLLLIETGWQEAERLNHLVGNLLDMTRLESGALRVHKQEGDLEEVIGAALARMKNRLGGYQIQVVLPGNVAPEAALLAPMDVVLIEQALVNLLQNAAKFSPPGSRIEVRVERCSPPGKNAELRVSIVDEGPGIPEGDLERVFEKFYRAESAGRVGGTGLGLSIARGMVEAHGGRIWAANRAEGGAVFTLSIPATGEA